nr:hypothetical protein CFP56_65186 [Quercus suber]
MSFGERGWNFVITLLHRMMFEAVDHGTTERCMILLRRLLIVLPRVSKGLRDHVSLGLSLFSEAFRQADCYLPVMHMIDDLRRQNNLQSAVRIRSTWVTKQSKATNGARCIRMRFAERWRAEEMFGQDVWDRDREDQPGFKADEAERYLSASPTAVPVRRWTDPILVVPVINAISLHPNSTPVNRGKTSGSRDHLHYDDQNFSGSGNRAVNENCQPRQIFSDARGCALLVTDFAVATETSLNVRCQAKTPKSHFGTIMTRKKRQHTRPDSFSEWDLSSIRALVSKLLQLRFVRDFVEYEAVSRDASSMRYRRTWKPWSSGFRVRTVARRSLD